MKKQKNIFDIPKFLVNALVFILTFVLLSVASSCNSSSSLTETTIQTADNNLLEFTVRFNANVQDNINFTLDQFDNVNFIREEFILENKDSQDVPVWHTYGIVELDNSFYSIMLKYYSQTASTSAYITAGASRFVKKSDIARTASYTKSSQNSYATSEKSYARYEDSTAHDFKIIQNYVLYIQSKYSDQDLLKPIDEKLNNFHYLEHNGSTYKIKKQTNKKIYTCDRA